MTSRTAHYERPKALAAVESRGHVVIEASAGTGKTYTLEHLVVDLLLRDGARIDQILAVTFTEKASRELRERVRAKLQALHALAPDESAPGADAWTIDDAARKRLGEALFAFDSANIFTIHGFCQRVLQEHAFAHRRLFEQTQIDGRKAFGRAFRDCLREALARDDELRGALERVLATGAGVSTIEETLYVCFRERGVLTPRWDPEAVRQACSKVPSAAAFAETVEQALGGTYKRQSLASVLRVCTGFADLARQLAGEPDAFVLGERFRAWAREEKSVSCCKDEVASHLDRIVGQIRGHEDVTEPVLACLEALAAHGADAWAFLTGALLDRIRRELVERKAALGQFDFDDMLLLVAQSLDHPVRGPHLVESLRRRLRFALIDEFQDTDEVQWAIFRRIFFEADSGHRLFVIGDPKQAIYGFRNADLTTYLRAKKEIEAQGGSSVPLTENHRSTAALIEACNLIFAEDFFTGDNRYDHPVVCGEPDLGLVDARGTAVTPVQVVHLTGGKSQLTAIAVREGLGSFIAREIARLVSADRGPRWGQPGREVPLAYQDVFILTRTDAEGRQLGQCLRRHAIPHAYYRQEGLFQTDEAADIYDVLHALASPRDRATRLRAYLSPFFGVELSDLAACHDLPESHPLATRIERLRGLGEARDYAALFGELLDAGGLVPRLLFCRQGERELTNYRHIVELLLEDAHRTPFTLSELALHLKALIDGRESPAGRDANVQRLESEAAAVQILTMHKAKGLEAPIVFVAGGFTRRRPGKYDLGIYHHPSSPAQSGHGTAERRAHLGEAHGPIRDAIAREQQEEDERLLYVALTRAKARLYLPYVGETPDVCGPQARWRGLTGTYARLNARLGQILAEGERDSLFSRERVRCDCEDEARRGGTDIVPGWEPPPALLVEPARDAMDFEQLKRVHAGAFVTSYSRLHKQEDLGVEGGAWASATEEPRPGAHDLASEPGRDELPGGRTSGVFLHEVLEAVDYASLADVPDVGAWCKNAAVMSLLEQQAAAHGVDRRYVAHTARLVFATLSTPLSLPGLVLPRGLAAVGRKVAEMEFLYPVPESHHPVLGQAAGGADVGDPSPFLARRGFVQGVVDLVFEHEGRVYFLDWKSDRLSGWDASAMTEHVRRHYRLQAALYTLGVLRLLGLRSQDEYEARFGGLLYCFVRGMGSAESPNPTERGKAVYFERPSWGEVRGWEHALLAHADWERAPVLEAPEQGGAP